MQRTAKRKALHCFECSASRTAPRSLVRSCGPDTHSPNTNISAWEETIDLALVVLHYIGVHSPFRWVKQHSQQQLGACIPFKFWSSVCHRHNLSMTNIILHIQQLCRSPHNLFNGWQTSAELCELMVFRRYPFYLSYFISVNNWFVSRQICVGAIAWRIMIEIWWWCWYKLTDDIYSAHWVCCRLFTRMLNPTNSGLNTKPRKLQAHPIRSQNAPGDYTYARLSRTHYHYI